MRGVLLVLGGVVSAALAGCDGDITGDDDGPDPVFAEDHPRIYMERNRDRLKALLDAGDPKAVRFKEMVDAELGGADLYEFRGWYAALIGQITGDARYCEYAVALVDEFVRTEESAISGGGVPEVARDSYLYIGEEAGDVLLTYDWCFDSATADQKTRWLRYARQAVANVWNPEGAEWGGQVHTWSGWSINNPSNNYYYSFLRGTMLMGLAAHGEIDDAEGWLGFFRDTKIGNQLVPTFEEQLQGGGSREGTGYGVAMHRLWELYDLWQGSTGEDISALTSHTRASMLWLMHAIMPTRDRLAPIGDHSRDSTAALFDYHRNYLQEIGYLFPNDPIVPEVKYMLASSTVPEMDQPFMYVYDFLYQTPVEPAHSDTRGRAYYGPGTGVLFARSSWETDATWVGLIAGPYSESHAHQDQGSFLIYKEGWLAYDPIVESRSGIRKETELHNQVRITSGGSTIEQHEGTESHVVALHRGDGWLHVAADVTPAFNGAGEVQKVERELVFLEPDCVVVFDRVQSSSGTQQIWQLNAPTQPSINGATATVDGAAHDLVVRRLAPATATSTTFSWASDGDFSAGYRLDETVAGGTTQFLHVLSIDGTVTAATRSDADGQIGAEITFAGGATATVRFGTDSVGGSLVTSGGIDETLSTGVDSLPE